MTAKLFKFSAALLGLTVASLLGPGIASAQYGQSASPSMSPSQNAPAPKEKDSGKPQKINKAEEAAYKNVLATQGGDPAMAIQVAEDFITKFPMSRYVGGVYGMLTGAYFNTGNTDKMFACGAKALEARINSESFFLGAGASGWATWMARPTRRLRAGNARPDNRLATVKLHRAAELNNFRP